MASTYISLPNGILEILPTRFDDTYRVGFISVVSNDGDIEKILLSKPGVLVTEGTKGDVFRDIVAALTSCVDNGVVELTYIYKRVAVTDYVKYAPYTAMRYLFSLAQTNTPTAAILNKHTMQNDNLFKLTPVDDDWVLVPANGITKLAEYMCEDINKADKTWALPILATICEYGIARYLESNM